MARKKTTKKKTAKKRRTKAPAKKRTKKKTARRKTKKKAARRKTKKKAKRTGRRGRRSRLANVPFAQLKEEMERRERALLDQREELQQQLDEIDAELAEMGRGTTSKRQPARAGRRPDRRPRGKMNLVDSLHAVLRGTTMGVSEVADAVRKAGYKTKSANFRVIVNQALTQHPKHFKKVARGRYTAK